MSLKWLWPLLLVTTTSWADANFDGQVRTLGIDKVDIVAAESVPAWMQPGLEIQAFGWPDPFGMLDKAVKRPRHGHQG